MAFVFKAEKKAEFIPVKQTPGPGQYVAHEDYKVPKSYAPFLSTAKRERNDKKEETLPGPGTYNISIDMKTMGQNSKMLVSSVNPQPNEVERPQLSNFFKSETRRFEPNAPKLEAPGPGAYYKESKIGKKIVNPNATVGSARYQMIERAIKNSKFLSIPSIPSNLHSYGYSETENHDLLLNKNPLLEVQQFVGPGYYEVKDGFINASKGVPWQNGAARKFEQLQPKSTTANVGPGSYDTSAKAIPLYKLKPSVGFASGTRRAFDPKDASLSAKGAKRGSYSAAETRADSTSAGLGFEEEVEEEFVSDATPGPGYYYNEHLSSSIRTAFKPAKLQFFGSGSERFKQASNSNYLGPGEYNTAGTMKKKKGGNTRAPFQSSNIRFDRDQEALNPGPGSYNPKVNLQDKVQESRKKGYVGNFGTTDKRFKEKEPTTVRELEMSYRQAVPGPGTYYQEGSNEVIEDLTLGKKGTSVFKSSTIRQIPGPKQEGPAPGTYDIKYYDLANKIIKEEEDPELSPKKAPFCTTAPRFKKPKTPEIDDEELLKPTTNRNLESILKEKMKPKNTSVFASGTQRVVENKGKEIVPGPGAYHDPATGGGWNKRTFNILFTVD